MCAVYKPGVKCKKVQLDGFEGIWAEPKKITSSGVILYLHGGGYVAGDLKYAKGFSTVLAHKNGIRVFAPAYRLAPEYPFPAALEDALAAYEYLIEQGYGSEKILLCGESAGGGLIYALCLKLKELGKPMPCGLLAISPWSDLTASGGSYEDNQEADPSMTKERLQFYAAAYADTLSDPLVSPLFGDLQGLPPSLIFVGGDEILLDDSRRLQEKLLACGCRSRLYISPGMWHGYVLFCVEETKPDFVRIGDFISEVLAK